MIIKFSLEFNGRKFEVYFLQEGNRWGKESHFPQLQRAGLAGVYNLIFYILSFRQKKQIFLLHSIEKNFQYVK